MVIQPGQTWRRKGGDRTVRVLSFVSGLAGTIVCVMTREGPSEVPEDTLRDHFEPVSSRTAWDRLLEDDP